MTPDSPLSASKWTLERLPSVRTFEVVAYHFPLAGMLASQWPTRAGGARRDDRGTAEILHFAPGRWLVHAANNPLVDLVDSASQSGMVTATDVTGKWQSFRLSGPSANRVLAASIEIETLRVDRDCAALLLFDCPAILAWADSGYSISVRSSHVASFLSAIHESARSI